MKILIVDDDFTNLSILTTLLEKKGYEVVSAFNGEEALHKLRSNAFDLILSDVLMPVMDGYAATRALRARERESGGERLPVVALTANALSGDSDVCLAAGMDGYLSKPFTIQKLGNMLSKWISVEQEKEPVGAPEDPRVPAGMAKPSISPIDKTVLDGIRELEGAGNPGFFERIVTLYLSGAPGLAAEVLTGAEKGDTDSLLRAAHTLKSSSANVGATGLSDLCRKIEGKSRAGEPVSAGDPLLSKFEGEFRSVQEALKSILEGISA